MPGINDTKTKSFVLTACGLFSVSAMAEKAVQETAGTNVSSLSNWPVVLLVLAGMVGFIFALAWFAKRFGGFNISGNRDMRIVSTIPVGTRERIALLDVKGQQFLIGVTAHQISHLHSFEQAVVSETKTEAPFRQSEFFNKLQLVMNPQKRSQSEAPVTPPAGRDAMSPDSEQPASPKRDENAL